jgi:hypothetical protein
VKNFPIKITAKQLKEFLEWEHDHQMKLFPWMEEENAASNDQDNVSTVGPTGSCNIGGDIPDASFR